MGPCFIQRSRLGWSLAEMQSLKANGWSGEERKHGEYLVYLAREIDTQWGQ